MVNNIKNNKNIIAIKYFIAFCPLYKRKIFKIEEVKIEFENIIHEIFKEIDTNLVSINYRNDCLVILEIKCTSTISAHEIIGKIKNRTSSKIREIIKSNRQALWTKNYLAVTNEKLSEETIEAFLKLQKGNPREEI
jgi:REP element-mobilizing transposase RayT